MKQEKKEKAGKPYIASKHDAAPHTAINCKSPTFWPVIDAAAKEQIGNPNLSKLVAVLQQRDPHFKHLFHQWISEWRDKSVVDKIVWSKKTENAVKKEFFPGGHQTHYNVFVSIFSNSDVL